MLSGTIAPDLVEAYQQKKAELPEEIAILKKTVEDQKACRKAACPCFLATQYAPDL